MELIQAIVTPLLRHANEPRFILWFSNSVREPEEKKRIDLETVRLFAAPSSVVLTK